jgi:hypothetical protein
MNPLASNTEPHRGRPLPMRPMLVLRTCKSHRQKCQHQGIACVEFTMVAPVLVLCTFAIVDVCNVLHLKQKINTVAFETVRVASLKESTYEGAAQEGAEFARARSIHNARITVESHHPEGFPTRASLPLGFTLRAQVTVPTQGNIPGPFLLFRGGTIESQLVRMSAR